MAFTEILPGIHYVGVNDRTTTRFESLWSLPYGVSYNSYLVIDEKVALIDTVEVSFGEQFIDNIRAILKDRPIDYLVVDHMEPDHSSSIKTLRLLYPEMQIVGNAKTLRCSTDITASIPSPGKSKRAKAFRSAKKTSRSIWRRWFTGPK